MLEGAEAGLTVELPEATEIGGIIVTTTYDHNHPDICSNNSHIGLELYTIHDPSGDVPGYCFNQNYDNPDGSGGYTRLVATPELLFSLA